MDTSPRFSQYVHLDCTFPVIILSFRFIYGYFIHILITSKYWIFLVCETPLLILSFTIRTAMPVYNSIYAATFHFRSMCPQHFHEFISLISASVTCSYRSLLLRKDNCNERIFRFEGHSAIQTFRPTASRKYIIPIMAHCTKP